MKHGRKRRARQGEKDGGLGARGGRGQWRWIRGSGKAPGGAAAAESGQESGVKRQVGSRWLCGSCTAPATCHHRLLLVVRPAHRCRKVKALPPGRPANKWSSQFEKLKRQGLTGASRLPLPSVCFPSRPVPAAAAVPLRRSKAGSVDAGTCSLPASSPGLRDTFPDTPWMHRVSWAREQLARWSLTSRPSVPGGLRDARLPSGPGQPGLQGAWGSPATPSRPRRLLARPVPPPHISDHPGRLALCELDN